MNAEQIVQLLESEFGEKITGKNLENIDPWVEVEASALLDVGKFLRDDERLQFNGLQCISGVDYFEPDPKKAKRAGFEPHFEVVYHFYSYPQRHRITVKVVLPRWKNDQPGELPEVPSVTSLWSTAEWHEREVFDLSGVQFTGHPKLRRILCPEDWVGHPLRKDYEMPLEYHGVRGK
jgi:NADH-quinone oxidoreductase subunit C